MPSATRRSTPGPSRLLTEDQILTTALEMLRGVGASGLSLRRLAAELGVTPMTLYRYYPSKDALLDAIADRAIRVPAPTDAAAPWYEQLRDLLNTVYHALRQAPHVAELMAIRSVTGPGIDDLRERILTLLVAGGLASADAVLALGVINRYLLGCAMVEGKTRRADDAAETSRLESLDPDRYPTLSALSKDYIAHESPEAGLAGLEMVITDVRRRAGAGD